jgi:hemoglobin
VGIAPNGSSDRTDINSPADVNLIVRRFYQAAIPDPLLGPVFRAADVDWSAHIPLVSEFWEGQLLGTGDYRGNVLRAHLAIMPTAPFGARHVTRWLELFDETVDEYFAGPTAEHAKQRAHQVGGAIATAANRAGPLTHPAPC